jgi:hypothetical protein
METVQRTFLIFVFSSCFREFRVMDPLIKKESHTPNRKVQSQIKDLLASLTTCSAEGEPDGSPRLR